jgi:hypothetical protein
LLRTPDDKPFASNGIGNHLDRPDSFPVSELMQQKGSAAVFPGVMDVLQVAHSMSVILLLCDTCKTCLTAQVLISTAFPYISRSAVVWNSLTYYSEKLAETADTFITLMESMMAGLSPLNSVEQNV